MELSGKDIRGKGAKVLAMIEEYYTYYKASKGGGAPTRFVIEVEQAKSLGSSISGHLRRERLPSDTPPKAENCTYHGIPIVRKDQLNG